MAPSIDIITSYEYIPIIMLCDTLVLELSLKDKKETRYKVRVEMQS